MANERDKLKRLSVTINLVNQNGYSSKTVFNNKISGDPSAVLLNVIKELGFIAYFNLPHEQASEAFIKGSLKAEYGREIVDIEDSDDVPF